MSEEIILVKYRAEVEGLEKDLEKVYKDLGRVDTQAKSAMGDLAKSSKKAEDAVEKVDKEVVGLGNSLQELASRIPGVAQVQEFMQMGKEIGNVSNAVNKTSGSFKVLKVAIASTGIGALIIAIVALISYFKRTDDGATKLEGVLGALGAAMDEVTGFVAELGSEIFNALSSMEGFKQGISDLGKFLLDNIINRFTSIITLGEALGKVFEGDFAGATKKANDAMIQFTLGIEDGTDKFDAWTDRIAKAAQEAYEFAVAMDAISDAQRDLNVEIAENEVIITELIKQSKNHSLSLDERIDKLEKANAIELDGLNKTLELENQKLELIKKRNQREKESINQRKVDALAQAKTDKERLKIENEFLSINDDLAQEEADQQIKIANLRKASIGLIERNNTAIVQLKEQAIQEELKKEHDKTIQLENIEKERFLNREISEKELVESIYKIQLDGLERQRQILLENQKDVTEIDKAILDMKLHHMDSEVKAAEAHGKQMQKIAQESAKKKEKDLADEGKRIQEMFKAQEKKEKADKDKQSKSNQEQAFNEAVNLADRITQATIQRQLNEQLSAIDAENEALQKQTDTQLAEIDKRAKAGKISEEQSARQKEAILAAQKKKEDQLQVKAFEAQKQASIKQIEIDTAVASIKTLSQFGFTPAGLIAVGALLANAALSIAEVRKQKPPKFAEGGEVGGKPHSQGGTLIEAEKGEFVTKVSATKKYKGALQAINEGYFDEYVMKNYLPDIIKKQQMVVSSEKKMLEDSLKAIAQNTYSSNTEHLERLTKSNKNININNVEILARKIGREVSKNNNHEMK